MQAKKISPRKISKLLKNKTEISFKDGVQIVKHNDVLFLKHKDIVFCRVYNSKVEFTVKIPNKIHRKWINVFIYPKKVVWRHGKTVLVGKQTTVLNPNTSVKIRI